MRERERDPLESFCQSQLGDAPLAGDAVFRRKGGPPVRMSLGFPVGCRLVLRSHRSRPTTRATSVGE